MSKYLPLLTFISACLIISAPMWGLSAGVTGVIILLLMAFYTSGLLTVTCPGFKSVLRYWENDPQGPNEDEWYWHIDLCDENGVDLDLLLTEEQLKAAKDRYVKKNSDAV